VFGSALRFVAIGTALGLGAAAMATRAIAGQLYGVAAIHLPTYAVVAGLVVVAAAAATWWPARRAARIDPAITLRTE
jgi:ABC-type lipoprotein release transport system permease subunit